MRGRNGLPVRREKNLRDKVYTLFFTGEIKRATFSAKWFSSYCQRYAIAGTPLRVGGESEQRLPLK